MRKLILLFILIAVFFIHNIAYSAITVTASKSNIPRGQASVVILTYQFFGGAINVNNCYIESSSGSFNAGNNILEINSKPLRINVLNNSGTAIETLNIPIRVLERAINKGYNSFTYQRSFMNGNCGISTTDTYATFYITTEAAADFDIKRIELYFENRRAEITVPKYYEGLKAFADIKFSGSGLLQGYWEVDGRIISYVNQHITYGNTVTFQTPQIPSLPTFEPGVHVLRFVITKPSIQIPIPSALYFVTTEEVKKIIKIKLQNPENNAKLEYAPIKFEWEKLETPYVYLIQFFEKEDSVPIFSAYTKNEYYMLSDVILNKIFQPNKKYFWKVIGFDMNNSRIAESDIRNFSFFEKSFVPGQIIISITKADYNDNFLNELSKKYKLQMIENYYLKNLESFIVLFQYDGDVLGLIEELKKDNRITIAQPNFIFHTFSDPLCKMIYAFDLMKIDKIHRYYKGNGIKIALIDTGVDYEHKDLKNQIKEIKNFIKNEEYKKEIHGTAVAGVISAKEDAFGIKGVAPLSEIYSYRACSQIGNNPEGRCISSNIAKALDEAISKGMNVVNMSFGSIHYDNLIASLIKKGYSSGILFVAPLGNLKNPSQQTFPASLSEVISVGGLDENNTPYPNEAIANKAKVLAPAVNIFTTFPNNKYNFLSGTSLSSAYISGLMALFSEKNKSSHNKNLPAYQGNICKWEEELFKIELCEN